MDNAIIRALRERAARFTSLDSPQGGDVVDVAADVGAGFVPVVGTALSARDFERARREGDRLGMGLAAAGMLPVVGGVARAAGKARKGTRAAEATAEALRKAPQDEALRTAQENAVRMLGLPPGNTPMDRARAMGFVNPVYRGTNADEVRHSNNVWVTDEPSAANYYSGYVVQDELYPMLKRHEGGNVMPLLGHSDFIHPDNASPLWNGGNRYQVPPSALRSKNAAFDPARINENDIMGYATPAMLGTLALGSAGAMGAVAALRQRDEDKDKKGK